jgi:hypothetical protein
MNTQQYLLTKLAEAAAEIIQIASKASIFGMDEKNPYVENAPTNKVHLNRELHDLMAVAEMLGFWIVDREHLEDKKDSVTEYMQIAKNNGRLS